MTVDRFAKGYEPRWDIDAELGRQGELFVASAIEALKSGAAVEVKTDAKFALTGNLYIENECQYRAGWKPSGLSVTSTEMWAFVLAGAPVALIVPTTVLRQLVDGCATAECMRGSHPTRGWLLPIGKIIHWARTRKREAA